MEKYWQKVHDEALAGMQAIISKLSEFKLGFVLGTGCLSADEQVIDTAKKMGVADADGNIDLDMLKKATTSGMEAAGELHFPMLGIHLQRDEIDRFFKFVETGALS